MSPPMITALIPSSSPHHQHLLHHRPASSVATLPPNTAPPNAHILKNAGSPGLGKRSVSLNTLQPTVFQPRMAQLETLEAKMASIEVSLSNSPRRKKLNGTNSIINSSIRSIPKEIAAKELEALRNALKDKENIIQSLKGQLTIPGLRLQNLRHNVTTTNNNNNNKNQNNNNGCMSRELSEVEKKQAEERLSRLRNDTDAKRLAIKNLKMALERLDITDNIDVRIQQAELEYQLGREELNLLTLLEETRALQHLLEECNKKINEAHTLYSCLSTKESVSIHAVEVNYDPKSPRFGASQKDSNPGLYVDWALEDSGLAKGDRFLEVNGKMVLAKGRDDLARLLSAAPDPALIVVLRRGPANGAGCPVTSSAHTAREMTALRSELDVVRDRAEEAQRSKDSLRTDNIRLTHRISYLEEQVSELLTRLKHNNNSADPDIRIVTQSPVITSTVKTSQNVTNINISSQPASSVTSALSQNTTTSTTTTTSTQASISSAHLSQQPLKKTPQQRIQYQQKGPQVNTMLAPQSHQGLLESSRDMHSVLPGRSKSSLSNVSNTHIPAPSPQPPSEHSCHKSNHRHSNGDNHRHKHRSSRGSLLMSASTQDLDQRSKPHHHHHHHHHRDKDYNSETNSAIIETAYNRNSRKLPESHHQLRDYHISKSASSPNTHSLLNGSLVNTSETNLMDQSYRKATRIVQDLTKHNGGISSGRDSHLYEKHSNRGQQGHPRCLTASEKYNAEPIAVRKQYNTRKSTSVLDFRSEIHIGPKYADSKSVEALDTIDIPPPSPSPLTATTRLYKKLHDSRSVKSLDFDSDRDSNTGHYNHSRYPYTHQSLKNTDYTSEPIHNNPSYKSTSAISKPRPTPPKKPLRLSLHRAQSLQSVDSSSVPSTAGSSSPPEQQQQQQQQHQSAVNGGVDNRKPMKRNYKGEGQLLLGKLENGYEMGSYEAGGNGREGNLKWTTFNQSRSRENIIYANENGHWC